ncbi:MAG TPA: NAD(P)/FAD-dependent oxidoreductase [Pseudonocardiaceae bacterium]|nr:NAD(P)/FAD-dependent oxidoreductase [Pseudonocardiaceae bacterium]
MSVDQVAIIGAGFAGLCMAIQLTEAGVPFTIYEKADDIGGVWRDNTYPGAGCDVPSALYSYSFATNPRWSRAFPLQDEILGYLRRCADRYGLRQHIRFGVEISGARYADGGWRLTAVDGQEFTARVLVPAVGQLNRPKWPDLPGMADFAGVAFHSARWRHDHDLAGRTVAVIGTGPSAAQFVPHVAATARKVYVFQRSANWVLPKWDYRYGRGHRLLFRSVVGRLALRGLWFCFGDFVLYAAVRGQRLGRIVDYLCRRQLRTQVPDPALRAVLTPDFPAGCKRILISDDYLSALARDNVEVITAPVAGVTPDGLVTADGNGFPVDTIVYGTGFTATEFLAPMEIVGRTGRRLRADAWADGAAAYLGMTVPEFPNLFLLYGPNTNLGNNSVVVMIEAQVRYVMACIRRGGTVEVNPSVFARYQESLAAALRDTVWVAGCTSWYKTESGRVTNNWPRRVLSYRDRTRRPMARDFLPETPESDEVSAHGGRG